MTASDLSRRDRKRLTTRDAIVAAGEALFAARAMEGVSIDEIVEAADLSKGSFYNHFDDKLGLASAIVATVRADLETEITAANAEIEDAAAMVTRALCVVLAYGMRHPVRATAMANLQARATIADTPLNQGAAAAVRAGLATGQFRGLDLECGILVVIGSIQIALRHVMNSGSTTPAPEIAATMGAAMLRGLGLRAASATRIAACSAAQIHIGALP